MIHFVKINKNKIYKNGSKKYISLLKKSMLMWWKQTKNNGLGYRSTIPLIRSHEKRF